MHCAQGIADLIVEQMKHEGLPENWAIDRIWMFDIDGLVTKDRPNKNKYAKDAEPLKDLEQVIRLAKPTCIVGVSAVAGAFTPSIIQHMAELNERPIILSLSNPTSKSECTAEEAYRYTKGQTLFASGSPFPVVTIDDKKFEPAQGNNAYIFPAMALAVMACGVRHISDEAFIVAAKALAHQMRPSELANGRLYPGIQQIRPVTLAIAAKLCEWFYQTKQATYTPEPKNKYDFLKNLQYNPVYGDPPLRK